MGRGGSPAAAARRRARCGADRGRLRALLRAPRGGGDAWRDPTGVPSHSAAAWRAAAHRVDEPADFAKLCPARALVRRTSSPRGAATVCLVLLTDADGDAAAWSTVGGVVDSASFRPQRKAFELLHAGAASPTAAYLAEELGIAPSVLGGRCAVLAIEPLKYHARLHPPAGEGWGTGDAAVGAFGRFVVSLEDDDWDAPLGAGGAAAFTFGPRLAFGAAPAA